MQTVIKGVATAISPIVHCGDQRGGTFSEFNREKRIVEQGKPPALLPIITGNAIRGMLRDRIAEFNLKAAGIQKLPDLASFYLLFSGGALVTAQGETYINVAEERRLRELLPAVSLLGGSVGNRIIGGKLEVSEWIPLAREYRLSLPDEYASKELPSVYDLLDVLSYSRRDDTRSARAAAFVDRSSVDAVGVHKETLAKAGEADEPGAATQMRYHYECLIPGTQFYVEFTLHNVTEVEFGTFLGGLALFAERPAIGGRSSSGLGKVKLELERLDMEIVREPVPLRNEEIGAKIQLAMSFLAERSREVKELLGVRDVG
jgi:CRISPR type IV-associated protein Csf2